MVQAMGSQVMFGQQTPEPGGTEAVSFSPAGQLGHVIIYGTEGIDNAPLVLPTPTAAQGLQVNYMFGSAYTAVPASICCTRAEMGMECWTPLENTYSIAARVTLSVCMYCVLAFCVQVTVAVLHMRRVLL